MPYIMKMPYSQVKSSDYELIRKVQQEFDNMWEAQREEFDELFTCWKFFFSATGEQWDDTALKYKAEHKLRAGQYNLVAPKVNLLVGAILADEYDFRYDPIDEKRNTGVEALENAYYCDKEVCHFDRNRGWTIRDGIIHMGVLEPVFDRTWSRKGNIWFRRAIPGRWVFDPYWKNDDDKQCKKGAKHGHFTASMLKETYKNLPTSENFEKELKRLEKMPMDWTSAKIDEYNYVDPTFDHAAHVIEYHYVTEVHKKRILAYDVEGAPVLFPASDDNELLEKFAAENNVVDWKEAQVTDYDDKVDNLITICPEWFPTKIIEKGKPEIQIQGLPAIQFTAERDIAGRNKGIVHDLIDPQKDVNYAKSKMQEYLACALGGGGVYNKKMMQDDDAQEDFESNNNDPQRMWGIDGDPSQFMSRLRDHSPNPALVGEIQQGIEFFDRISRVSAAMQAETESANEPASLYAMKLRQSRTAQRTIDDRVRYLDERMAEAYFYQAQISYADKERTFTSKDGKREATLNQRINIGDQTYIKNKVEEIPRSSITIFEAPNNLTKQLRDQAEASSILQTVPETYREVIALATGELIKTTAASNDIKQQYEDAIAIEVVKAKMQNIAEIQGMQADAVNSKLLSEQAKMQIQQLMQGIAPMDQKEDIPEQISPSQESAPQQGAQFPLPAERVQQGGKPEELVLEPT